MSESLKAHPLVRQWLGLGALGNVQAFSGKVDLGQGISHALRLIVAQELRLSPSLIDMVPASTHTSPDEAVTSGSLSLQHSGAALRCAASHWREMCRLEMAQRCGVDVAAVRCANGQFSVQGTTQTASFAELTSAEMWQSTIDTVHVQSPYAAQDTDASLAKPTALRPDVASKVFGEFE
jgi:nicotinate dehydrogenase subunit B